MPNLTVVPTELLTQNSPTLRILAAGEAIDAGEVVYRDATTLTYKLAQCDGTADEADAVGIAAHDANATNPVTIVSSGVVVLGATAAPIAGVVYMLSPTPGKIMPVTDQVVGQHVTVVGVGAVNNALFLHVGGSGEQRASGGGGMPTTLLEPVMRDASGTPKESPLTVSTSVLEIVPPIDAVNLVLLPVDADCRFGDNMTLDGTPNDGYAVAYTNEIVSIPVTSSGASIYVLRDGSVDVTLGFYFEVLV